MTIPTRGVTLVDVFNFYTGKGKFLTGGDLSQHLNADVRRYDIWRDGADSCFKGRPAAFEAFKAGNVEGMARGLGLNWPLYIPPTDKEVVLWARCVIGVANIYFSNGGPSEALAKDELKTLEADLVEYLNQA